MSRKERPTFDVESPPAIVNLPPPAPSADRLAALLGKDAAANAAASVSAPESRPSAVVSSGAAADEAKQALIDPASPTPIPGAPAPRTLRAGSAATSRQAERGESPKPVPTGARTHERKRDGAHLRRVHVRMPLAMERKLKLLAVQRETAVGELVVEALEAYYK